MSNVTDLQDLIEAGKQAEAALNAYDEMTDLEKLVKLLIEKAVARDAYASITFAGKDWNAPARQPYIARAEKLLAIADFGTIAKLVGAGMLLPTVN